MDDCRHVLELLEGYIDREVSGADVVELRRHLDACEGCADREDFVRRLRLVVRRSCGSDALPPGLEERVRRAIASAQPADPPGRSPA